MFLSAVPSGNGTATVLAYMEIFRGPKDICSSFHPVGGGHQICLREKCMKNIHQAREI